MPREAEDFPTIPGFVPIRSGDALETAESPSVGTAATVPADVLASLDRDDTLCFMILGDIESQNVLPLVYADLRGRLSSVLETITELQEIRSHLATLPCSTPSSANTFAVFKAKWKHSRSKTKRCANVCATTEKL